MKLRKRIFSLLMMLCMIVTLMPVSYNATETGTETESGTLNWNYNISFEDGSIANDANATIWLTNDHELSDGLIISEYAGGTGSYEFSYAGDKFLHNNIEYTYAYITYNMPSGYVFSDGAVNSSEPISGLGLFYTISEIKSLENGTVNFVAVPSDDNEDNLEGTTKDFYVKIIDSATKEVFSGVSYPMVQYYDSNNTYIVEGEIEKVGDGLFKVSVDTQTYNGCYLRVILPMSMEYCIVETQSPYVYTAGGVYIPVNECFTNGDTITVEVESCEYLDYEKYINFENSDGSVFDDVKVTVKLSNGADDTQKVVYSELTGGSNTIRVRTYNGKFPYTFNHKTYSTIEVSYELPEGYVVNGNSSGTWCYTGDDFENTLDLTEIVVEEKRVESGELTFNYQCVETHIGDYGNSMAGDVIPDATMTAYFSQALSDGAYDTENEVQFAIGGCEGSVTVSYVGDKFIYNGQEYDYVMFLGNFSNGYSEGHARTVEQLKEDSASTQYFYYKNTETPAVSNTITIKFNRGEVFKNLPCVGGPYDLEIEELESMVYQVEVDEEDIICENGSFYLVSSLNELFPTGIPEAPDHEIAGNFLGWQEENYNYAGNTTLEEYCVQPDEEFRLLMSNTSDGLVLQFNAIYDRKAETFMASYVDELGITKAKLYVTYVDFPFTVADKYEMAKNVIEKNATEIFEISHVQSYGNITVESRISEPGVENTDKSLSPIGTFGYYGMRTGIIFKYENVRTGEDYKPINTFEKTKYTFMLEDGTVVNGVKVNVSLTNSTDASKVTIETSTSGQGYFVIEHKEDVIYYGGDTYDGIEVEYEFPEGYVLKDTDISGTTVWYRATDWCSGGGTFWLLEKLPEPTPEVEIIIPDDDAPADEEVKVEVPEEKPVVSEDKMDDIIEANKKHPVKIETNDVLIIFPIGSMDKVDGKTEYDFGVRIEKDYDKAHDNGNHYGQMKNPKFEKDEFVLRINYNYSGQLPGEAEITIPVGKAWAGKTLYYYQVLDDGTYEYTGQSAVVDEKGRYTIKQAHCSDYVIVTEPPTSDLLYYLYNDGAEMTTTPVSPKTGDINVLGYLMFFAITGMVVPFTMRRKVK